MCSRFRVKKFCFCLCSLETGCKILAIIRIIRHFALLVVWCCLPYIKLISGFYYRYGGQFSIGIALVVFGGFVLLEMALYRGVTNRDSSLLGAYLILHGILLIITGICGANIVYKIFVFVCVAERRSPSNGIGAPIARIVIPFLLYAVWMSKCKN